MVDKEFSEEATFDKLRRIPYNQACVEYTTFCLELVTHQPHLTELELKGMVDLHLRKFGWKLEELNEYWRANIKPLEVVAGCPSLD